MAIQHPSNGSQELAGKVALVTGGAKNIGRAISLALAAAGASVAVNTLSSREEAEAVVNEIRAAGGTAEVFLADIADAAAVRAAVPEGSVEARIADVEGGARELADTLRDP